MFPNLINGADIGMVQSGGRTRFAPEAFQGLVISREVFGKELQGDLAAQGQVFGLVDHTHPAASEFFHDVVMRDSFADHRARSSSAVMLEVLRLLVNDPKERKMVS